VEPVISAFFSFSMTSSANNMNQLGASFGREFRLFRGLRPLLQ
jgi:hypothetical protein